MAGLSTPSLGITHSAGKGEGRGHASSFQLPLSGSPPSPSSDSRAFTTLSTPSLGITRGISFGPNFVIFRSLSTPSLGITQNLSSKITIRLNIFQLPLSGSRNPSKSALTRGTDPFNSLSRDHRARFRDFPALRGVLPRHLFAHMISKTTI